jgi:hypothetical protein
MVLGMPIVVYHRATVYLHASGPFVCDKCGFQGVAQGEISGNASTTSGGVTAEWEAKRDANARAKDLLGLARCPRCGGQPGRAAFIRRRIAIALGIVCAWGAVSSIPFVVGTIPNHDRFLWWGLGTVWVVFALPFVIWATAHSLKRLGMLREVDSVIAVT